MKRRRFHINFPLGILVGFCVAMTVSYFVFDAPVEVDFSEALTLILIFTTLVISAVATSVTLSEVDYLVEHNAELEQQKKARLDRKDAANSALLPLHLGKLRHYIGRTLQIADEVNQTKGEFFSSRSMVFQVFEEISPPKDVLESIFQCIEISEDELHRRLLIQLMASIEFTQSNLRDHCLASLSGKGFSQQSIDTYALEIAPLWHTCFMLSTYTPAQKQFFLDRDSFKVQPLNIRVALTEHASSFLPIDDRKMEKFARNHNNRNGIGS